MNSYFNYARLLRISENQEPYRGSENRFPINERRYGHKYFLKEIVDGVPQFKLCYWYKNDPVTEPNVFGIVRSDNTIEFAVEGHYMYQGLRQIMSARSYRNGYFKSSIRHGGIIYTRLIDEEKREWRTIPIFKGLRMNIDTMEIHDSSKYSFVKKTINREKSKALLDKYENAYKVAEVMFINMDKDKLYDITKEIGREYFPECWKESGNYSYLDFDDPKEVMAKADEILESSPFDSFMLYINAMSIWWSRRSDIKECFTKAKKKIFKAMQENKDVFNVKEFNHTHDISSSVWDLEVKVNNQLVHRYK